jgi:flagellar motility protein MotE (MotC chaperone)
MRTVTADFGLRISDLKSWICFCIQSAIRNQHSALVLSCVFLLFAATSALAQDDALRLVESQRIELKAKAEALKRDEQRLNALRVKVDEKIAVYAKLVSQMEAAIKKVELIKGEKMEGVVKAYESMAAEDAAVRLSALDEDTLLQIMTRMKSKKAGAIIALMDTRKAAALTRNMTARSIKSSAP